MTCSTALLWGISRWCRQRQDVVRLPLVRGLLELFEQMIQSVPIRAHPAAPQASSALSTEVPNRLDTGHQQKFDLPREVVGQQTSCFELKARSRNLDFAEHVITRGPCAAVYRHPEAAASQPASDQCCLWLDFVVPQIVAPGCKHPGVTHPQHPLLSWPAGFRARPKQTPGQLSPFSCLSVIEPPGDSLTSVAPETFQLFGGKVGQSFGVSRNRPVPTTRFAVTGSHTPITEHLDREIPGHAHGSLLTAVPVAMSAMSSTAGQ